MQVEAIHLKCFGRECFTTAPTESEELLFLPESVRNLMTSMPPLSHGLTGLTCMELAHPHKALQKRLTTEYLYPHSLRFLATTSNRLNHNIFRIPQIFYIRLPQYRLHSDISFSENRILSIQMSEQLSVGLARQRLVVL